MDQLHTEYSSVADIFLDLWLSLYCNKIREVFEIIYIEYNKYIFQEICVYVIWIYVSFLVTILSVTSPFTFYSLVYVDPMIKYAVILIINILLQMYYITSSSKTSSCVLSCQYFLFELKIIHWRYLVIYYTIVYLFSKHSKVCSCCVTLVSQHIFHNYHSTIYFEWYRIK